MKERPILVRGPLIQPILDDIKTHTRRIMKPQPHEVIPYPSSCPLIRLRESDATLSTWNNACPYGQPGDQLWVRENLRRSEDGLWGTYEADGSWVVAQTGIPMRICWHSSKDRSLSKSQDRKCVPSIHMPRWASRITLEIVDIRVERLQDISEKDAIAEGIEGLYINGRREGWINYTAKGGDDCDNAFGSPVASYRTLWESINGPGSWELNPWVWVVVFRRVK